jgi:hypothetical protein
MRPIEAYIVVMNSIVFSHVWGDGLLTGDRGRHRRCCGALRMILINAAAA